MKELKEKYSLAIDTIKFPVKYDGHVQRVLDSENNMVCDIRGWGRIQKMSEPQKRQDQIGELIAELLNSLQKVQTRDLKALRKADRWYYVKLILVTPFWFCSFSSTKKSWPEFRDGLIEHEHIYDGEIEKRNGTTWQSCSHPGCYVICPIDDDHPVIGEFYRKHKQKI